MRAVGATMGARRLASTNAGKFDWADPLQLDARLTEDERAIRDQVRDFCQAKLMPRVLMANREEKYAALLFFGAVLSPPPAACAGLTAPSCRRWAPWACWAPPSTATGAQASTTCHTGCAHVRSSVWILATDRR